MYSRTYFTKDNTILYDSTYNFGNSNIVDLFYGGDKYNPYFSRYIFHFDVSKLQDQYNNCELGNLSNVTHKLKFKHSGFTPNDYACMPTSYKICLFKINQDWDEGCGVSANCDEICTNFARLGCTVSKSPSNWHYAQSGVTWEGSGGTFDSLYSDPEYLMCVDVNCDSPDLNLDVTDIVNGLILDDSQNYGYGLAFHFDSERITSEIENHVVFFGKDTNTFYEPFIETEYLNPIIDDRAKFYLDKLNRLYLFVGVDGESVNLDSDPIVQIYNESNVLQFTLTGTCQDKGIYYVEFEIPTTGITRCYAWTDKWTNLSINSNSIADHSMQFSLVPSENYYNLGYNTPLPETTFSFGFRGIKREEVIKQGDKRKVYVDIKTGLNNKSNIAVDNVFYKLYLREDAYNELTIIDWMPLNRGVCENWFYLDTSWMIQQSYLIDFKVVNKGTIRTYTEQIKFHVIV